MVRTRTRRRLWPAAPIAVGLAFVLAVPASAQFPFPPAADPYDYTQLHIQNGSCEPPYGPGNRPPGSDLPANFDCIEDWKLANSRPQPADSDYDPVAVNNPQELLMVRGPGTNDAWEVTTGRPDTVIAVMDSGIRWDENRPNLVNKFRLSRGELPVPNGTAKGGALTAYDVNGDGVFNVKDYAGDARVTDLNGNTLVDPQDLIRTFSDGVDDDRNGYPDDIAGWDFFEGDNDPNDDVDYGHGTGEAEDSAGETGIDIDPQCPNCLLVPMRVGDSFVADINHWAEAVVYSVDNGISVVQEALGTLNHTGFAQAAADYAYRNGVLIVASQADESAGHHNYPAALNHTMLVNSVTSLVDVEDVPIPPGGRTYLAFNGCTNFGGYSWVTVASTSCSSDATGQSAGMAGLLYSAARNMVDLGVIDPGPAGRPLSAEEAKQLFRLGADDIDFSTPKPPFGPPNNFASIVPASQRFVTTAGWDQITGWGRISTLKMISLVAAGTIPPEADVTSPRWWQSLPETGSVPVVGRAAAPRAASYRYRVQLAPGVQPPRWPAADAWTTVFQSNVRTAPTEGVLATLNLGQVRAAIDAAIPPYTPADDPTSRDLPERDAFRIRVVVCAGGTCPADVEHDPAVAIEQRHVFSHSDPSLLPGWPRFLGADGAVSPAFEDLDRDGKDELVVGDGNGFVHAFRANGTEAPGWPVHTNRIPIPQGGRNAYTRGQVARPWAPMLLGSPTVADLDGNGSPEVAAADIEGRLYVWDHLGHLRAGFPVRGNPAFSEEPGCQTAIGAACDDFSAHDVRDQRNTVDRAFTAMPSAGDLDPAFPGLELVIGSNDGHVYAFRSNGKPVPGWPVLIRDPATVESVDPVTHQVDYVDTVDVVRNQRKIITTPTLGDVDGDGDLEVAVNANEQYVEDPNVEPGLLTLLSAVADPGNTRVYLLHRNGTRHAVSPAQQSTPHPHDQAYVAGWPVPIAMIQTDLLPYVGEGSNGAPVLANVTGDGDLELATASIGSPPYLLNADGTSALGTTPDGHYRTMATQGGAASDVPSVASLGGGVFGRIGAGPAPAFAMGASGLRRLLDVVLPEQQLGAEDHLGAWDPATGQYVPGFPAQMNDLMFFNTPAVADVTGDGLPEVLQGSAMYDLRAYGAGGTAPAGWPKFTGGWIVATPAVGDLDGDGSLDVSIVTREGNVFVYRTGGSACGPDEWPKYQHDLRNTGAYGTDARRPGAFRGLSVNGSRVTWTAPGDDGRCGTAARYEVRYSRSHLNDANYLKAKALPNPPAPAPGGTRQSFSLPLAPGRWFVRLSALDEAGNRSFASQLFEVRIPFQRA